MPTRRLLTPLNVVLTLVAAAAVAAMTWMGFWQLSMFDARQHDDSQALLQRDPVPLDEVIGPDSPFPGEGIGRPVTITGRYQSDDTFVVKPQGQRPTLVTPLLTANGSGILVQRGYGSDLQTPTPTGRATVTGFLEPNVADVGPLGGDRRTTGIDTATLVNEFDYDLYSAYVVADREQPSAQIARVAPPLPDPGTLAGLRNLLYAVQWWLFAAFAVYMWWQIVVLASRDGTTGTTTDPDPAPSGDETPGSVG